MIDLAWLAGVLDADGSIGLEKVGSGYRPFVTFVANTNETIVKEVERIVNQHELPYHLLYNDPSRKKNARPCWQVRATNKKQCTIALETLIPYLRGKKAQAELVLEWCQGPKRRNQLSIRDLQLVDNVKRLNSTGLTN